MTSVRRRRQIVLTGAVVAVAVLVGVLVVVAGRGASGGSRARCAVAGTSTSVTPEQSGNAATIAAVGYARQLPDRAVTIAIATAMQESRLRNLDYGDRDSLGLFQQRPSQGWGKPTQLQDPVYAAGKFYDALVDVTAWQTRPLTEVAQAVQRSGYPDAYAKWEADATALTAALLGRRTAVLGCTYGSGTGDSTGPAAAKAAAAALHRELPAAGQPGTIADRLTLTVTGRTSWVAASWLVANGQNYGVDAVQVAGQRWSHGKLTWSKESASDTAVPAGSVSSSFLG